MKHLKSLIAGATFLCTFSASAYDFEVDGICYAITSEDDLTCEVQARQKHAIYDEYTSDYSGDIIIPERVEYNDKFYQVTSIGRQAFNGRSDLSSIIMPNTITSIGYEAFQNCSGLLEITLPQSLDYIENWAFYGCSGLTSINLPNKVTYVGIWSFGYCEGITEITIPASVTTMGGCAFSHCPNLEKVVINSPSIDGINWNEYGMPFKDDNLKTVEYGEGIEKIQKFEITTATKVVLPSSAKEIMESAFEGYASLSSIEIPSSVETISENSFKGCANLASITIPNSVTSIGYSAFYGCVNLQTATLSRKISTISQSLFSGCVSLKNFSLPGGTIEILEDAFKGCSSIESINIPAYCSHIEGSAFSGCSNLKSFSVSSNNTTYSELDGVLMNKDGNKIIRFPNAKAIVYTIPSNVIAIEPKAFSGSNLQSITIPASVEYLGTYAFLNNERLTEVIFEDSDETIEIVGIWNTSYTIYGHIFSGCPLESVYIGRNIPYYNWWGTSAAGCFEGKTSLTSVTIGSEVSTIYEKMFANCSNLSVITIPENIIDIGDAFLAGCTGLNEIHSLIQDPPALHASAFEGVDKSACTLYVPSSAIETYESTPGWLSFDNIQTEENVQATSVELNKTSLNLVLGNSEELSAIITPSYASNKQVKWHSSNPEVAIVTELGGVVTAVGEGNAVITATTTDGTNLCATCELTVSTYNYCANYEGSTIKLLLSKDIEGADSIELREDCQSVTVSEDIPLRQITYTRNYSNTKWQSLYVPFTMRYEDWKDDYDVAYINSVRQYDNDNDGTIDETIMDVLQITGGELYPNMPYLIKAKTTGEKTIMLQNATLYPTEENSIDCSTMLSTFTFTGTYSTIPAATLEENGYYAMGGGGLIMTNGTSNLKPFRWYMGITSRSPMYNTSTDNPSRISVHVIGEEDDMETSLYGVAREEALDDQIFNFNGQMMDASEPLVPGFYIKNGKKVIIR